MSGIRHTAVGVLILGRSGCQELIDGLVRGDLAAKLLKIAVYKVLGTYLLLVELETAALRAIFAIVQIDHAVNGAVLGSQGELERADLRHVLGHQLDIKLNHIRGVGCLRRDDQVDLAALCRACHDDQRQHHGNSE